jgi:hypothetical protein
LTIEQVFERKRMALFFYFLGNLFSINMRGKEEGMRTPMTVQK